jgi:hypothetical protein
MKTLIKKRGSLFIIPLLSLTFILIFSLSAPAATNFSVTTDSSSYGEHSTVHIRLKNTGTDNLNLKYMWWQVIIRKGGGTEVYTGDPKQPPGTPNTLAPGETARWSWNMRDNEGNYQPAGTYRIKVHIDHPKRSYSKTKVSSNFTIGGGGGGGGGGGTAKVNLRSTRKVYSKGGTVTFKLRNTGTKELDTSRFSWIIYRSTSSGPQARSTHNSRPAGIPDPMPVGYVGSWSWDMRNNSGNFVNADDYELEVKLLDEGIEANCFFKVKP